MAEVYYLVLPDSAEELILGWPTLCRLGFVATKHYIELEAIGLRYPTILPSEVMNGVEDTTQFLNATYHEALLGPEGEGDPSGPVMHTVEVEVPGRFRAPRKGETTTFWIEPGPDLPLDCTLVEGP